MVVPLAQRIADQTAAAAQLYHRLVLLVGPPRSGKTAILREIAESKSWPMINLNLALAEVLLELTTQQRALKLPRLLDTIAKDQDSEGLVFDNIELLFSPELQQDPLKLLQRLARNRTIIATWAGTCEGEKLTYAVQPHPEFRRYLKPDALIVSTLDGQEAVAQAGNKEPA